MERLNRNIEQKVTKLLNIFPVVVVLGARQVGKTTLCKLLKPNWTYFDLQNPLHAELIQNDPINFFQHYPKNVIIDEAQENQELLKTLRGIIDEDRDSNGRFLLTGSSSPELLHRASETLAGRVGIVELGTFKTNERFQLPLSCFYNIFSDLKEAENILQQNKPELTEQQLISSWLIGGYPKAVINYSLADNKQWMANYFSTYINTDITSLFPRLKRHVFQRFLKMISRLSGTIVNKKELAKSLEISEKTVNEYINIAEGTFLWRSLLSYHGNVRKTLIKMPKGYIRDTGLLHYLLRIYLSDDLYNSPISGTSFEGFVIEEILNGLMATTHTNWQAYYYRTKHGAEIDLVLEGDFGIVPIEIKQGIMVRQKQLISLNNFVQENNLPLGLVINQSNELLWLKNNILQVPFTYL